MSDRPALADLPTVRSKCGYVCKYGRVREGELTPGVVLGVLSAKGVLDDTDPDEAREIAADVVANFGGGRP